MTVSESATITDIMSPLFMPYSKRKTMSHMLSALSLTDFSVAYLYFWFAVSLTCTLMLSLLSRL